MPETIKNFDTSNAKKNYYNRWNEQKTFSAWEEKRFLEHWQSSFNWEFVLIILFALVERHIFPNNGKTSPSSTGMH